MIRTTDLILSLLSLALLSPLLAVISILLRLTAEGKVVYKQTRIGRHLVEFEVFKFATMLEASPSLLTGSITVPDDPRVLPLGKYLRKSKLNELPQLANVLLGNMSLIGPRPHVEKDLEGIASSKLATSYSIRPGLSGISSILLRNEESLLKDVSDQREYYREVIAPFKNQLDLWFVVNQRYSTYWALILITVFVVLGGDPRIVYSFWADLPKPPIDVFEKL